MIITVTSVHSHNQSKTVVEIGLYCDRTLTVTGEGIIIINQLSNLNYPIILSNLLCLHLTTYQQICED